MATKIVKTCLAVFLNGLKPVSAHTINQLNEAGWSSIEPYGLERPGTLSLFWSSLSLVKNGESDCACESMIQSTFGFIYAAQAKLLELL